MYRCTGVPSVQKVLKLKMKMRQYDADEAGAMDDAVVVKPRFSKDCNDTMMAAGVLEKCRETESKNTTSK